MASRGFISPYRTPLRVLHEDTMSGRINGTIMSVSFAMPVTTHVPPLRNNIIATMIKSAGRTPGGSELRDLP